MTATAASAEVATATVAAQATASAVLLLLPLLKQLLCDSHAVVDDADVVAACLLRLLACPLACLFLLLVLLLLLRLRLLLLLRLVLLLLRLMILLLLRYCHHFGSNIGRNITNPWDPGNRLSVRGSSIGANMTKAHP
jgi:glucan phosphoethanolaminetransferase (alkaline phosphatase superfamily)